MDDYSCILLMQGRFLGNDAGSIYFIRSTLKQKEESERSKGGGKLKASDLIKTWSSLCLIMVKVSSRGGKRANIYLCRVCADGRHCEATSEDF